MPIACPNCHSHHCHRTRRSRLFDSLASLFHLRPWRCEDCAFRFYRRREMTAASASPSEG